MPNDPIDQLPLDPEEEENIPEETPSDKDAYASNLRQDLLEQPPEAKRTKGFARLFSGMRGIFGGKSKTEEETASGEPDIAQSLEPKITSTPVLDLDDLVIPKGYNFEEEQDEQAGEEFIPSGGEPDQSAPQESAFDLYSEYEAPAAGSPVTPSLDMDQQDEQQPEQAESSFPFLDLSDDEDKPGDEAETQGGSQATPFWEMYRIEGVEQDPEPPVVPDLPESTPPQPAPVTSEDEKEWKAFLSNLLKRQEDNKPSPLEMDDSQLNNRLQTAGLSSPAEDGIPRPKTGKLEEPQQEGQESAFAWGQETSANETNPQPKSAEQPGPPSMDDELVDDWFAEDAEEPLSAKQTTEPENFADPLEDSAADSPALAGSDDYWSDETDSPQGAQETKESSSGDWFSGLEILPTAAPGPFEVSEAESEEIPLEPAPEIPQSAGASASEASPERLRPIVLEDYEPPPAPEPEEPSALDEVSEKVGGFWRTQSLLTKVTIILLAVFMFGLAVSIPLFNYLLNRPQAVAPAAEAAVVDTSGQPFPIGLKLTGGWFFNLQPSHIEDGVWVPQNAEWLKGTEVRKVVAIPWSRQSDAVVRSLVAGDMLQLHMSDNYIQEYQVDSVEQVDRTDIYMYADNEASLVVILYQADSNDRWVIVSHLVEEKR